LSKRIASLVVSLSAILAAIWWIIPTAFSVARRPLNAALSTAAFKGDVPRVQALLNRGADVNARDQSGEHILGWAARGGSFETLQLLLNQGADVNARHAVTNSTALIVAAFYSQKQSVRLLLVRGANPDVRNWNGHTALMLAAGGGHLEIVKELLASRADKSISDKNGNTARTLAVANGHHAVAALIDDVIGKG